MGSYISDKISEIEETIKFLAVGQSNIAIPLMIPLISEETPQEIDLKNGIRCQLKLLLAEDNLLNQRVALHMLRKLGIRADVAVNGLEVLQALEHHSYDVVLMDVQVPEMDDFETAKVIRERWKNGMPHIIAVNAHALDGDRKRCIDAWMDDYLSKPVRMEELASAIGRSFKQQKDDIGID